MQPVANKKKRPNGRVVVGCLTASDCHEVLVEQKELRKDNDDLRAENTELKERLDRLEEQLANHGQSQLQPSAPVEQHHSAPYLPAFPITRPPPFSIGHQPPFSSRLPPHQTQFPQLMRPYGAPPRSSSSPALPPFGSIVSQILMEQKEREVTERSAIVVGMDESHADRNLTGTPANQTTDFKTVVACLEAMEVDKTKLLEVMRIGDCNRARNGKQILKVAFSDSETKQQFVDDFSQVQRDLRGNAAYARNDLMKLQRQERSRGVQPSNMQGNW